MENTIKPGCGYFDVTTHPYGCDFRRAGKDGVKIVEVEVAATIGHIYFGVTDDGRKVGVQADCLVVWPESLA